MGQPGDLLLIFADALVRSWKQITKFKPSGAAAPQPAAPEPPTAAARSVAEPKSNGSMAPLSEAMAPNLNIEGIIRDERGIRMAPETED